VTQGTLASWLKGEGQSVQEGEELFELETDKATVAVPAPASGILHIQVEAGSDVKIGAVVGVVETAGSPLHRVALARRVIAERGLEAGRIARSAGPGGRDYQRMPCARSPAGMARSPLLDARKRRRRKGRPRGAADARSGGRASARGDLPGQRAARSP
jgi:pyruvate/2-oxoglutarate dehydrogenase complex dihydrolipoamide acyltransferase (E2) component